MASHTVPYFNLSFLSLQGNSSSDVSNCPPDTIGSPGYPFFARCLIFSGESRKP